MQQTDKVGPPPVPLRIVNSNTDTTYMKGTMLGKGGFAYVYEVRDCTTNKIFADKIISKDMARKKPSQEKIRREISLHRKMIHPNVVRFVETFEDDSSIHIILEYCSKKSLLHMMRTRKVLTETEVQFFLRQICEGVCYIHQRGIVHRDLKLGNMFLTSSYTVKIGDFGLATSACSVSNANGSYSLCGTPNYIAPEVLQKRGHGFEADVWAIGCMTFAMLCGTPPFETKSLKSTYEKITANSYTLPDSMSVEAKALITQLLHPDPNGRGTLNHPDRDDYIIKLEFFHTELNKSSSNGEIANIDQNSRRNSPASHQNNQNNSIRASLKVKFNQFFGKEASKGDEETDGCSQLIVQPLIVRIDHLLQNDCMPVNVNYDLRFHCSKNIIVSKWIDYSNKYGFGYQLSDGTTGVLFNDRVRICENRHKRALEITDDKGIIFQQSTCNSQKVPSEYAHYTKILQHFARYMEDNLADSWSMLQPNNDNNVTHVKTSQHQSPAKGQQGQQSLAQIVCWKRSEASVLMLLSNGSLQINFFQSHEKLLFFERQGGLYVTLIGQDLTFGLSQTNQQQQRERISLTLGRTLHACMNELSLFHKELNRRSSPHQIAV